MWKTAVTMIENILQRQHGKMIDLQSDTRKQW